MATIFPTFRYDDAHAAIRFLCDAFGFSEHAVHERDGVIHHAELKLGDDYIMLGERRDGAADLPDQPSTTYVVVEEPDALYARAVKAGAEVVREPVDQDYGSREFAVRDPGGNVWSFGTYAPR
ncbi:MAG TPA: VOC family protein [Baekduia sp.]